MTTDTEDKNTKCNNRNGKAGAHPWTEADGVPSAEAAQPEEAPGVLSEVLAARQLIQEQRAAGSRGGATDVVAYIVRLTGWTNVEVARSLGVSNTTVSRARRDAKPASKRPRASRSKRKLRRRSSALRDRSRALAAEFEALGSVRGIGVPGHLQRAAVSLARDYSREGIPVARLAGVLGVSANAIYAWRKKYRNSAGQGVGSSPDPTLAGPDGGTRAGETVSAPTPTPQTESPAAANAMRISVLFEGVTFEVATHTEAALLFGELRRAYANAGQK